MKKKEWIKLSGEKKQTKKEKKKNDGEGNERK